VYADALAAGWNDWSWGLVSNTQQAQDGPALGARAYHVRFGASSGFKLAHAQAGDEQPIDPAAYAQVVLHLHPGATLSPALAGLTFRVGNGSPAVRVADYASLKPGQWTEVRIPLAAANSLGMPFSFLELNDAGGASLHIDAIWLEPGAAPPPTTVDRRVFRRLSRGRPARRGRKPGGIRRGAGRRSR
jgi:hypothetical protein